MQEKKRNPHRIKDYQMRVSAAREVSGVKSY